MKYLLIGRELSVHERWFLRCCTEVKWDYFHSMAFGYGLENILHHYHVITIDVDKTNHEASRIAQIVRRCNPTATVVIRDRFVSLIEKHKIIEKNHHLPYALNLPNFLNAAQILGDVRRTILPPNVLPFRRKNLNANSAGK